MALIKCKGCGKMVSTRAESCPKCGYSVRLSMEQQEDAANTVITPPIPEDVKQEEQEYVYDDDFQSKKITRQVFLLPSLLFLLFAVAFRCSY